MPSLALNGGPKTRERPWPAWPRYDRRERRALRRVLASRRWGTLGPEVLALEQRFARFVGARRALAVSSGTAALEIALRALGIGAGDEVIVPAYTFVATASAVLMVNATPVFADLDPATLCLDPGRAEAAVTGRTRAIIPVHLAGHPADMDGFRALAQRRRLHVVEDCAQAHGAQWRGLGVGTLGTAGAFSFQGSKNMAAGEGGMIVTDDADLAERCWSIHHIGRRRDGEWYEHHVLSGNYRMTEWQAAVLGPQLERLQPENERRHRNAELLSRMLADVPGIGTVRQDPRATRHGHHLFLVRYDAREFGGVPKDAFVKALAAEGIPAAPGYRPLHRQPLFESPPVRKLLGRDMRYAEVPLPVTDRAAATTFWITQNVLLGAERDLRDIREAILKLRAHAAELAGAAGGAGA